MDHLKRMRNWRHNSFQGHTKLAMKNMRGIIEADSTTKAAQDKAREIYKLLEQLQPLLKERVDHD